MKVFHMSDEQLSDGDIKEIHDSAVAASDADEQLEILRPLAEAQAHSEHAAFALVDVVKKGNLTIEQALGLLSDIYESHKDNDDIVICIGNALEAGRDIDMLNDAPPDDPLFDAVISRLSNMNCDAGDKEKAAEIAESLSCTTRLMGRQYDKLAEENYARLVELLPNTDWAHYNQGLFFKTRGHFSAGVAANQRAIELADKAVDSHQWNLGICATGAGQGEVALGIWKEIGQKVEMGRFNLPEGGYPSCLVRLAERPLSERDAENDSPGLEETIWIERLSPCHGVIRSVLFQDLGVDYGDVILFDGAPITYRKFGDHQVPIFPHLSTIKTCNYQFFDFAATQQANGEIYHLSDVLDEDAIIYSHTENYSLLCATCWRNEEIDHEHNEVEERNVVTGRIAIPPDMAPKTVLEKIDNALSSTPENRVFSPDLSRAAGFNDRATIETRRYNMLCSTVEPAME